MAVWPGTWPNCAACWGRSDDGRRVLPAAALAHLEGRQLKTSEPPKENPSAPNSAKFIGTDNPRHLRTLAVLLRHPVPREQLDSVAGASNSPELVAELRRRGLEVPCKRIRFVDRDGCICRPGVYSLTIADRRKVHAWMARRNVQGGSNA
jgi:hypothetical protein